ncbi:ATP-dependent helicase HrpA [Striga asiatica]|uniref:ATP-dependent helicase HrpA n=1 Tax=Striga asiatica TaxID=4170 RepID=A0A5A7QZX9_STRAF|nr:ATP-dependent helicase HrpA [Striga asiatica]
MIHADSKRPEEARHILSIPLDRVAYSDMWKWLPDKNDKLSVKSAYSTILKAKMCYELLWRKAARDLGSVGEEGARAEEGGVSAVVACYGGRRRRKAGVGRL